ncbi:hypothetical protein EUGRSUZ_D02597 [Eucalyptus grandis]|uniref:Uncharacterized protein n=2 Tax=Eucalyptus grandis TaxID=71139 RepID=A0ACC3L8P0_EUCGR|nr:hypothetical protein EUGRSUZ_D02597 [Eucalyptus grandis]
MSAPPKADLRRNSSTSAKILAPSIAPNRTLAHSGCVPTPIRTNETTSGPDPIRPDLAGSKMKRAQSSETRPQKRDPSQRHTHFHKATHERDTAPPRRDRAHKRDGQRERRRGRPERQTA